jgi:hypothetical protein
MNEEPTEDKPYMAGPKTFETADEALAYAETEGYTNAGFKFGFLNSWFGPRKELKDRVHISKTRPMKYRR